jgi:hypothetical protein
LQRDGIHPGASDDPGELFDFAERSAGRITEQTALWLRIVKLPYPANEAVGGHAPVTRISVPLF